MARHAHDMGREQQLADAAQRDGAPERAVAIVADAVEIDRGLDLDTVLALDVRQGTGKRARADRIHLLVRHRHEEQVADAVGIGSEGLAGGKPRRKARLQIEKPATGQKVAALEIGPGQHLARRRRLREPRDQGVPQRFGIGRERSKIAVIVDRDRVEMPRQQHRARTAPAHQHGKARAPEPVTGCRNEPGRRARERRRRLDLLREPLWQYALARRAGDGGLLRQPDRPMARALG